MTQLNIQAIDTLIDVKEGLHSTCRDAEAVEAKLGNTLDLSPTIFAKTVYSALSHRLTLEGIASRVVTYHGTYLRYSPALRSWQAYVMSSGGKGSWQVVLDTNVRALIARTIENIAREVTINRAAVKAGCITELPMNYSAKVGDLIRSTQHNDRLQTDILLALQIVLAHKLANAYSPDLDKEERALTNKLPKIDRKDIWI